ncbi:PQQ-binding-like beta-propeller repeat protein [bacterium]|nr:PQQ-binding-like beta-propeller repeat protein [bacterium]
MLRRSCTDIRVSFPGRRLAPLALILLLIVSACSGQSGGLWPAQRGPGGLPGLPQDEPGLAPRAASELLLSRSGADYSQMLHGLLQPNQSLRLNAPGIGIAYAVYSFPCSAADQVSRLDFFVSDRQDEQTPVWLAIADYSTGRWEWLEPQLSDSGTFALDAAPGRYASPGGQMRVAVVSAGGKRFRLLGLNLLFDNLSLDLRGDWALAGRGNSHARRSGLACVTQRNVDGIYQLDSGFDHGEAVFDSAGNCYVGSRSADDDGVLYAMDPQGGLLFSTPLTGYVQAAPAIAPDGKIYLNDIDGQLNCISPAGQILWEFDTGNGLDNAPLLSADGSVIIAGLDSNIYSVGAFASLNWSYQHSFGFHSTPALDSSGNIYAADAGGDLLALDSAGGYLWTHSGEGEALGCVARGPDGSLYYVTDAKAIYAVNSDGSPRASVTAAFAYARSVAIASNGDVLAGRGDGMLLRYSAGLEELDSFQADSPVTTPPLLDSAGNIFFGCLDGKVYGLSPQLDLLWLYSGTDELRAPPSVGNSGELVFPTRSGRLLVFGPDDPVAPGTPTGLSASDGLYAGKVTLSWDTQYDALSFEVFRDDTSVPLATVDGFSYEDNPGDLLEHSYYVRALNDYGASELAGPDSGSLGEASLSDWCMYRGSPGRSNLSAWNGPQAEPVVSNIDYDLSHVPSGPVFGKDGSYYVRNSFSRIYAYNPDGSPKWDRAVEDWSNPAPLLIGPEGNIYAAESSSIHIFNEQGDDLGSYSHSGEDGLRLLAMDEQGILYVAFYQSGNVYSVNPDGTENWDLYLEQNHINTEGAALNGTLYVGNDGNNKFYWIDTELGTIRDSMADSTMAHPSNLPVILEDSVNGDRLIINTESGAKAFDNAGNEVHSFVDAAMAPSYGLATLCPDGKLLLDDGYTLRLYAADFSFVDEVAAPASHRARDSVMGADGKLYLFCQNDLFCYGPDLAPLWDISLLGNFFEGSAAIGPDGKLYMDDTTRRLWIYSAPAP